MAHFIIGSNGITTEDAQATVGSIAAAGDDVIITNDTGATVEVTLGTFNAALTGPVNYPNDNADSHKEESIAPGVVLTIPSKSYVHIPIANSSGSAHNFTVAASGVRTTHRTAAAVGQSVWAGVV